jgi:Mg-chelatase subunit ChlD
MSWHTRLDTPLAKALGVEAHVVTFEHRDDPGGPWRCVALQIPECSEPMIAEALGIAQDFKARIVIVSDTAEQAEAMAVRIAITLGGQFKRIAYERAAAGQFGTLM